MTNFPMVASCLKIGTRINGQFRIRRFYCKGNLSVSTKLNFVWTKFLREFFSAYFKFNTQLITNACNLGLIRLCSVTFSKIRTYWYSA